MSVPPHRSPRRSGDERGAYLVLYAVLLLTMLTVAGLVVDLARLRADRSESRRATDAAASAAAITLGNDGARTACSDAWRYVVQNLELSTAGVTAPDCNTMPASCDNTVTPQERTATVDDLTVSIVHPVENGSTLMRGEVSGGEIDHPSNAAQAAVDGDRCERIAVRIVHQRRNTLGDLLGVTTSRTEVHSVARAVLQAGPGDPLPSLIALEPRECRVVHTQSLLRSTPVAGTTVPGIIMADSDGTGSSCNTNHVFSVQGSGAAQIQAQTSPSGATGILGYFAPVNIAFNPSFLARYTGARQSLKAPVTKTPIFRRYNCSAVTVTPRNCNTTTNSALLDLRNAGYGTALTASAVGWRTNPLLFANYPGLLFPGATCASPPPAIAGNVLVNCPSFNVNSTVAFTGGDVIFAGNVHIGSGGNLQIGTPARDTVVAIRGTTGLTTSSNNWQFDFKRTFVYQMGNGRIDLKNGVRTAWSSPLTGNIFGLLYWSDGTGLHELGGNGQLIWDGVFYQGNATLALSGTTDINATNVQLWVNRIAVETGAATVTLAPNPNTGIRVSGAGARLLR